jgi:transposase
MYLKQAYNVKTGRTHLSVVQNYWDKEKRTSRSKTIETFGYLDELSKTHEDPIAYYKDIVEKRNSAEKEEAADIIIIAKRNQVLERNSQGRRNYGYIIIIMLFYELGLDRFLINRQQRETKIEFNTSSVMKLLVISRILSPGSKKKAFEERGKYFDFEKQDAFRLIDIYRALSHFSKYDQLIQKQIHERITINYGRNMELIYYDVTNYYFEIDMEDKLRKKGYSKENRKSPIVQMGLSMDADGLPISYELFPGNESEKLHLRPMVSELVRTYDAGRIIAVADSAQNTGNNIYYLDKGRQYYVFSQSISGGSKSFKEYVINPVGYEWHSDKYKRKSRNERREIRVDFTKPDGTLYKKDLLTDQRQIVFYSEKYATRARATREAAVKKAQKIIENPAAYTSATSYGALKYVKNVTVDNDTGEIKPTKGIPCFDIDKLREDEKYDGYYAIVTNVFNEGKNAGKFDDDKIIDIYRGLWRIEDSFRVTKEELDTRPVHLSREERIRAHFLICYISLVIIRLIQKRTDSKYSPAKLIEAINNISCSYESENMFLFDYRSEISDVLGGAFGIDFTMQRLSRMDIKKNIGEVKIV